MFAGIPRRSLQQAGTRTRLPRGQQLVWLRRSMWLCSTDLRGLWSSYEVHVPVTAEARPTQGRAATVDSN